MATWQGISHARMTRSMKALKPAPYKILSELRRRIPDGETRQISQAELARYTGLSESTISANMPALTSFIRRERLGIGRGRGYQITVLPPPEIVEKQGSPLPEKGSDSDPCQRSFELGTVEPQSPAEKGSESDPYILLDHDHEQQQHDQPPQTDKETGPEALKAALEAHGAHPKVVQRVLAASGDREPALFLADLAIAAARPEIERPIGLALEAWAQRQRVIASRPRAEHPQRPERPQRGRPKHPERPIDASQVPRRQAEEPPSAGDGPPSPYARALGLAPDAGPLDLQFLAQCLAHGDTAEAALAALEQRIAADERRMCGERGGGHAALR